MRRKNALWVLLTLLAFVFATVARGQERVLPSDLASLYTVRSWTLDDGLPDSRVCGVTLGADGYLWLVTPRNLVRFDGMTFVSIEMPAQTMTGRIEGLFQDSAGALWIYGYLGILRFADGLWWQSEEAGVPRGRVTCIAEHPDGKIYFARENEVYAWHAGKASCVLNGSEFSDATGIFRQLAFTNDGALWVVLGDGVYGVDAAGAVHPKRETEIRADWVLLSDTAQAVLYAHGSFVCLQRENNSWKRLPEFRTVSVRCLLTQPDGALWVGHDAGVDVYSQGCWSTHKQDALVGTSQVLSMAADQEGNTWLATSTGLTRLRRRVFMDVPILGAHSDEGVSVLWVESGVHVWVGLNSGGLGSGDCKGLQVLPLPSSVQSSIFHALYRESSGKLWCGGIGGSLWTVNNGSAQRTEGFYADSISAIMGDGGRPEWVATGEGLLAFNVDRNRLEELAWANDPVLVLWLDSNGYLWVGHENLGLAVLRSGVRDEFLPGADLPGRTIRALYRDSEGVLWIGGMTGLSRWENGQKFIFRQEHGLWNESIRQISEDASGCLWLGTADGIMRIPKSELAEVAAGRKEVLTVRTFGEEAGLESFPCTGGVFFPLGDPPRDRLWFPTKKRLYTVDTRNLPQPRPAPGVRLVSLGLGANATLISSSTGALSAASLAEPGSSRDVSIGYTALDFTTIERIRFRYTLTGPVQQQSALTEERQVRFSRLPPGKYEFRVTACNGDGVWHPAGALMAWTVHPFFWETFWFRALVLLFLYGLVAAAVWIVARRRVKRRLKKAEREEELSSERARIARDLHDEIGAKLTRLSLLATMVAEDDSADDRLKQDAVKIAGTARETHRSFDEIVWSVNPRNDVVRSLSHYICKYAEDFFEGSNVACRCHLPAQVPDHPLDPQKRHQVFRSVKEGLNNVLKHASATQVTLHVIFLSEGLLRVVVADDGCGFDLNIVRGSGQGLRNMRERMHGVGGMLTLESARGKGTRLTFEVPINEWVDDKGRRWLRHFNRRPLS